MGRLGQLRSVAQNPRLLLDVVTASRALLRVLSDMKHQPPGGLLGAQGITPASDTAMPAERPAPQVAAEARRWERALRRALSALPVTTTCLSRALTLQRLLEGHGVAGSRVCIGVKRETTEFEAHAWVELGTMVLGDSRQAVAVWTPLGSVPAAPR